MWEMLLIWKHLMVKSMVKGSLAFKYVIQYEVRDEGCFYTFVLLHSSAFSWSITIHLQSASRQSLSFILGVIPELKTPVTAYSTSIAQITASKSPQKWLGEYFFLSHRVLVKQEDLLSTCLLS